MKKALKLFLTFFKIGALTFGGGYAMIPIMHREVVKKNNWISDEQMIDMIAVAEATPGAISVNTATFTGYKTAGFFGALAATFGVVLPSFIVISIISLFIVQFKQNMIVNYAFMGIRVGVVILILNAVWKMLKKIKLNVFSLILMLSAFICVAVFNLPVIYIIIASAVFGILYQLAKIKLKKE